MAGKCRNQCRLQQLNALELWWRSHWWVRAQRPESCPRGLVEAPQRGQLAPKKLLCFLWNEIGSPSVGTGLARPLSFHRAGTHRRLLKRACSIAEVRVNLLKYKPWRVLVYCGKTERCMFQKAASCVNWDWNSTLFLVMQEVQRKKNYG